MTPNSVSAMQALIDRLAFGGARELVRRDPAALS
jgi:hypothetical protein